MESPLYDTIGIGYNTTRSADPYITERLYQLLSAKTGNLYLDIGCGTGNYTIALANLGLNLYGIDPSEKMIKTAQSRNQSIQWILGSAENIPTESNLFEGIFGTLTLHHWKHLSDGFNELYRVLKTGGRIVFFTSTPEQMKGYWLNHYFPAMLESSIHQMPSLASISNAAQNAGFEIVATEQYVIQDGLKDHFLYIGKNFPSLYFDEKIRNGISSFSALANAKEVTQGLEKLNLDLTEELFCNIKLQYENTLGDYMFIVMKK